MNTERKAIKQQLDEKLELIRFTGHERVIRRTHPPTLRNRLLMFWNKEIVLPLKPIAALSAIILVTIVAVHSTQIEEPQLSVTQQPETRELIEAGGNIYWKDVYKQVVKQHDN
ncbi:hypothetical protein [Paenibacillus wynnii]|uniref:Uncharacterized protein n=1 Tax=Paenibacillus wynnii TaxID=268407 RepID=A0A098M960_9BACL|nr:hypothetical protein [Paenibacillus wynnii]KGE19090.1 hypothetical protein PWYN_06830 [Paenibacillus wynnii]